MTLDIDAIAKTPALYYETIGSSGDEEPAAHLVGTADDVRGTSRAFMGKAVILKLDERDGLIAYVRELERKDAVRSDVEAALTAQRDELRSILANERGEGQGPSEGWRYSLARECWEHRELGRVWRTRGEGAENYARSAMNAVDTARSATQK